MMMVGTFTNKRVAYLYGFNLIERHLHFDIENIVSLEFEFRHIKRSKMCSLK